jgi:hypothetical protein
VVCRCGRVSVFELLAFLAVANNRASVDAPGRVFEEAEAQMRSDKKPSLREIGQQTVGPGGKASEPGLIRLKSTGETFPGAHQPLISKTLFDQV